MTVYETEHGLLEVNETKDVPLPEGYYLARAYIHDISGGLSSIQYLTQLHAVKNVKQAQVNSPPIVADQSIRICIVITGKKQLSLHVACNMPLFLLCACLLPFYLPCCTLFPVLKYVIAGITSADRFVSELDHYRH
jgi:hypothetical protein